MKELKAGDRVLLAFCDTKSSNCKLFYLNTHNGDHLHRYFKKGVLDPWWKPVYVRIKLIKPKVVLVNRLTIRPYLQ